MKKSCSTSKYVEYISLTITRRCFFFFEISSLTSHQKKEFLIFVFLNIFSIFSQDVQSNLIFFCWWCCQIRLRKIEREKISIWRSFLKFRSWPTTFQLLKTSQNFFFLKIENLVQNSNSKFFKTSKWSWNVVGQLLMMWKMYSYVLSRGAFFFGRSWWKTSKIYNFVYITFSILWKERWTKIVFCQISKKLVCSCQLLMMTKSY